MVVQHMFSHFNVVTSAILWGVWNSRNILVFNRVTLINMKRVWSLILNYLRNWKVPFKDLEGGKVDGSADADTKETFGSDGVKCRDFG